MAAIFCLLVFLTLYPENAASLCPSNLPAGPNVVEYPDNGSCFEFVTEHKADWEHAYRDCGSKGGYLAEIDNILEENFFMSQLRKLQFRGTGVWLGLSDRKSEGTFVWTSGQLPTFTYWGPRQGPQAGILHFARELEDCVVLKYTDSGHWHDYPCAAVAIIPEDFGWVCQYKMPATTTSSLEIVG